MSWIKEKTKSNTTFSLMGSSENLSSIPIDQGESVQDDLLEVDLLHKMDVEDIQNLKRYFLETKETTGSDFKQQDNGNQARGRGLNKAEFVEALEDLSGSSMVALAAAKLFDSLDFNNTGCVRWENVLDAIIKKTRGPLDRGTEGWEPIHSKVEIRHASHCKREFIVKIVPLYTKVTFCYAVISKLGQVGVYDGEFNLLDSYKICLKPTAGPKKVLTGQQEKRTRRSFTTWVTDAVFVLDTYSLFFSASDRSLHLYDATGLIHVPLCLIIGLKNTPTCMDYYSSSDQGKPSLLFFGDDQGDVTMMQFHQPKKSLFKKKDPDKLDKFLWSDLKEQSDYVTYSIQSKVHNDAIIQVSYYPESQTILTCSNDSNKTMVLRHVEKRRRPYIFKVPRGIRCFHLEKSLHIIVTGSKDGIVRIWNQVVTKRPIVSLFGHKAPIVDVRVLKHMSIIISLSEKGVVKIWNIDDYYCQKTLSLDFPVFKISGSRIDFGTRSIFPGPSVINFVDELNTLGSKESSKISFFIEEIETWLSSRDFEVREDQEWSRNSVVVICCNYIAVLKLMPMPTDDIDIPEFLKKDKMLPPPAKEHYASVPSPWKIADFFTKTPPDESEDTSTVKSSSSSSTSKNMPLAKTFKKVQGITADPVKAPMKNMNTKRTQFKIKQDQMKMLVQNCAPHLALDLYDLAPIKFSKPLPMTKRMLENGIDASNPEQFIKGKFSKDSTSTTIETFSDVLSPRSSKSSKITTLKKMAQPLKGRQTPDWFSERIKLAYVDSSENSELI